MCVCVCIYLVKMLRKVNYYDRVKSEDILWLWTWKNMIGLSQIWYNTVFGTSQSWTWKDCRKSLQNDKPNYFKIQEKRKFDNQTYMYKVFFLIFNFYYITIINIIYWAIFYTYPIIQQLLWIPILFIFLFNFHFIHFFYNLKTKKHKWFENSTGNLVEKFVPSDLVPKDNRPLDPSPVGNLLRSSPPEFIIDEERFPARRRRRRGQNYIRGPLFFDGFV